MIRGSLEGRGTAFPRFANCTDGSDSPAPPPGGQRRDASQNSTVASTVPTIPSGVFKDPNGSRSVITGNGPIAESASVSQVSIQWEIEGDEVISIRRSVSQGSRPQSPGRVGGSAVGLQEHCRQRGPGSGVEVQERRGERRQGGVDRCDGGRPVCVFGVAGANAGANGNWRRRKLLPGIPFQTPVTTLTPWMSGVRIPHRPFLKSLLARGLRQIPLVAIVQVETSVAKPVAIW